jgi:hypothetical protein
VKSETSDQWFKMIDCSLQKIARAGFYTDRSASKVGGTCKGMYCEKRCRRWHRRKAKTTEAIGKNRRQRKKINEEGAIVERFAMTGQEELGTEETKHPICCSSTEAISVCYN